MFPVAISNAAYLTYAAHFQILLLNKTDSVTVLATEQILEKPPAPTTSVHTKETTDPGPAQPTYRQNLILNCEKEHEATKRAYEEWDSLDEKERSEQLESCRSNAWFAVHMPTRTIRILSSACRLRWCALCSKTRSKTIVANLEPWLRSCRNPKFLTLTLKHSDESLQTQIIRLYACFSTLRKRRYLKASISGGVWFFQIKFSEKSQQWHPHLHCVLDAEYMPHATLKRHWHEVTGDSEIVDIRAVWDPKKTAEYVARYAARPAQLSKLTLSQALTVMWALHGRRLCGTWGSAKEIRLTPKPANTKDEYYSVCSFQDLLSLAKKSQFAEKIRVAFATNEPLDMVCSLEALQEQYDQMWNETREDIPPPPSTSEPQLFDTGPASNCAS